MSSFKKYKSSAIKKSYGDESKCHKTSFILLITTKLALGLRATLETVSLQARYIHEACSK